MNQAASGLAVVRAQSDADLEAMIAVRTIANPDQRPPRLENLRHNLASSDVLAYLVATLDGEPAGCGFVDPWPEGVAPAHCVVVPSARGRGLGSALIGELGRCALAAGRSLLQGDVAESDDESRAYLERRGYEVVGGERAVTLELDDYDRVAPPVPDQVEIVSLSDRPELADSLYPVGVEAAADIPGNEGTLTFEQWRAHELDRPTRRRDLFFVAVAEGEPIGYASVDDLGSEGRNGLTAVKRAWRRHGVATALKHAQIEAAKAAGLRRLITQSEERNVPMSTLNLALGYRPDPSRSTLTMRGPASVRLPGGDR